MSGFCKPYSIHLPFLTAILECNSLLWATHVTEVRFPFLGGEYLYKLHENFNKRCVTSTPFACSIVCLFILTWTRDFAFYCLSYDLILHFITHIFPVLATRSFSSCFMFPLDIPPSLYLFLAFFLSSTMICLRITLYSPPF